jgi:hypothetical protein
MRTVPSDEYESAIAQAGRKHVVMVRALGVPPSLLQKNLNDIDNLEQREVVEEYIASLPYEARESSKDDHVINLVRCLLPFLSILPTHLYCSSSERGERYALF